MSAFLLRREVDLLLKVYKMSFSVKAYRVSSMLIKINAINIVNTSVESMELYAKYDNFIANVKNRLQRKSFK